MTSACCSPPSPWPAWRASTTRRGPGSASEGPAPGVRLQANFQAWGASRLNAGPAGAVSPSSTGTRPRWPEPTQGGSDETDLLGRRRPGAGRGPADRRLRRRLLVHQHHRHRSERTGGGRNRSAGQAGGVRCRSGREAGGRSGTQRRSGSQRRTDADLARRSRRGGEGPGRRRRDDPLLLFEKDQKGSGKSKCEGACAAAWPPLTTEGEAEAMKGVKTAMLGTIERKDGTTQVTYAGWPLYTYAGDRKAGEDNGTDSKAFGASWYPLHSNGKKAGH
ncbi:MAG: hypothetical protein JSS68_07455 [Actinobacteria bacterium]|nr:hypothetical protein [Actinomycetota bacterium]